MLGKKAAVFTLLGFFLFNSFLGAATQSSKAEISDIYSHDAIKERIVTTAINEGLDPALALSVAKQESNFDRSAKSWCGAVGLFQLMPYTAQDLGVNPYYIDQNIKGGVSYLKGLKNQFGRTELALAAYNAGPGAVNRYGGVPPYGETQTYVKNIMSYYKDYKRNPDQSIEIVKEKARKNQEMIMARIQEQKRLAELKNNIQQEASTRAEATVASEPMMNQSPHGLIVVLFERIAGIFG